MGQQQARLSPIEIGPYGIFPAITGVLRAHDPEMRMCVMYEWPTIGALIEGGAVDVSRNVPYDDTHGEAITSQFINCLDSLRPEFSIIVYDSPDHDGHASGWASPQYMEALHALDGYIARIIEATKRLGMYDETVFIVTADHGGTGTGHGSTSMEEMQTPFVIFGGCEARPRDLRRHALRHRPDHSLHIRRRMPRRMARQGRTRGFRVTPDAASGNAVMLPCPLRTLWQVFCP